MTVCKAFSVEIDIANSDVRNLKVLPSTGLVAIVINESAVFYISCDILIYYKLLSIEVTCMDPEKNPSWSIFTKFILRRGV